MRWLRIAAISRPITASLNDFPLQRKAVENSDNYAQLDTLEYSMKNLLASFLTYMQLRFNAAEAIF